MEHIQAIDLRLATYIILSLFNHMLLVYNTLEHIED